VGVGEVGSTVIGASIPTPIPDSRERPAALWRSRYPARLL